MNTIKQLFLGMDFNYDGKLSQEEMKQGIEVMSGSSFRFSKNEYLEMMHAIDKDNNGFIDYQEFIAAASDKVALVNK